jgi:hypothetical protein
MANHDHDKCLKPATSKDTIVRILSSWHFDFPRRDALDIVAEHKRIYEARGNQTALQTALVMIEAVAVAPEAKPYAIESKAVEDDENWEPIDAGTDLLQLLLRAVSALNALDETRYYRLTQNSKELSHA